MFFRVLQTGFAALVFAAGAQAALNPCERLVLGGPISEPADSLARFSGKVRPEANSEQRQSVELGLTPREQALGLGPAPTVPRLAASLRELGRRQAHAIRERLNMGEVELEAWPVQDDLGRPTWAFARVRPYGHPEQAWEWLDSEKLALPEPKSDAEPAPMLPTTKRSWVKSDFSALFDDLTELSDLYDKPLFGDAVWTKVGTGEIVGAWLPTSQRQAFGERIAAGGDGHVIARVIAQPARFNGEPMTLKLATRGRDLVFPTGLEWVEPRPIPETQAGETGRGVGAWPSDFESAYEQDVRVFAGELEARFPLSGRRMTFVRRNSLDPRNQLEGVVDYLAERYRALGLRTRRQRFSWRGVPQSNLVAVIPGRLKGAANKPILLADHIDTAFSEDEFHRTGRRVSAPGADDNATATAALLRAAEVLRDSHPDHDIWLVHLTGEEFPADDLGARHLISSLLGHGQDLGGLVLMDMIGYRKRGDRIFQINPADDDASIGIALLAQSAARQLAPAYTAKLRPRFDPKSYLYNTDGVTFSAAGYPVILLNEHINALENLNRPHYHQTSDTSAHVDFEFATAIARVAIETAARLSTQEK